MVREVNGALQLKDECTWTEEKQGLLQLVFENGKLIKEDSLTEIRERINRQL